LHYELTFLLDYDNYNIKRQLFIREKYWIFFNSKKILSSKNLHNRYFSN